jgi:phage-related protein
MSLGLARGRTLVPLGNTRARYQRPEMMEESSFRAAGITGLGSGVMELALRHRGDAFRVVYVLRIGTDIWVIHAFQKKSKSGIATPRQ